MPKKELHIKILFLVIILIGTGLIVLLSKNKTKLPVYFLMNQTITGKGDTFNHLTTLKTEKVEDGVVSNGSQIHGASLTNPYETKNGYKIFITEGDAAYRFYSLDFNGGLQEMPEDPFSVFMSGGYRIQCESEIENPLPLRDGKFSKIHLTNTRRGDSVEYVPSDYGEYSQIDYVGLSQNGDYAYFFVDNFFPSVNEVNSAVVRQNVTDKKDYSFILLASSTNETLNSVPENLEFLAVSGHNAFFKYASDELRWVDEQNKITIIKLNLNTGEFSDIGNGFKSSQIFVFSQDRSYMLVRDDPSISAEQMMYIYNTNDGTYLKSMNALTCNQRAINNSGKYIAEVCPGIGEDKILNVETGERTTVATYARPVDDTGYEVGYSETSFLDFQNPIE